MVVVVLFFCYCLLVFNPRNRRGKMKQVAGLLGAVSWL